MSLFITKTLLIIEKFVTQIDLPSADFEANK